MMEENVQNEEFVEKKHGGKVLLVLGIIALVIAIYFTVELLKAFNFSLFHGNGDEASDVGAAIVTIFFLPYIIFLGGASSFLSVLFSSISFAKYKKSIVRIIVFALSIINILTFVISFIVATNR